MSIWPKISKNRILFLKQVFSFCIHRSYIIIILLSILLKLYLVSLPAQPYDIATYASWGSLIRQLGIKSFFNTIWSDYLPLPIYLFAFISWLASNLHLSFSLIFKLFFSILELGLITWLIKLLHYANSRLIYLLLIISPALLLNTSWWGQTDSLPALLITLSLIYFYHFANQHRFRTLILSVTLATLAISIKPIVILSLPIFIFMILLNPLKSNLFSLIISLVYSLSLFILPALPITPNPLSAFKFLLQKAQEQATTYPYLSVNAFNFWNLNSNLSTWIPDNQLLLGLSLHTWGILFFSLLCLSLFRLWKLAGWPTKAIFRILATIFALFFVFTTRMHERHLLFTFPLLILAVAQQTWLLLPLFLLTLTYSFNLWSAFFWVTHQQTWPTSLFFIHLSAFITTLTTISLAVIWDWPKYFIKLKDWLLTHRVLFIILLIGTLTRFAYLGHPQTHIFDEVYHAFTAQELVKNNLDAWAWWTTPPKGFAYEWTHPPLAKYGMIVGLLAFGDNAFGWRFLSAFMGVVGLYGIYQLTLKLSRSVTTANLATFLVTIEGLYLVQSRIAMNDIYMLSLFIWSLIYALKGSWKKSALIYGLSLASKWSALYGLVPLSFIFFHSYQPLKLKRLILVARLLVIASLVYLLTYTPFFLSGYSISQFLELHRQMWYYHTHLVATHTYQSTPSEWIFALRPVWYWVNYYGSQISNIYAQSNPFLLWLGLISLMALFKKIKNFSYFLIYTLYAIFTLPWIFSPRIMFFYHYLPSATFLMIMLAFWLSSLPAKIRYLLVGISCLIFIILSPIYYGFPISQAYWQTLFSIFPTWQ